MIMGLRCRRWVGWAFTLRFAVCWGWGGEGREKGKEREQGVGGRGVGWCGRGRSGVARESRRGSGVDEGASGKG